MTPFADRAALPSMARRYALVLFFVLAYVFSWLIWGLEGRCGDGGLLVWLACLALVISLLAGPRLSYQPQPAIKAASPRQGVAELGGQ